MAFLWFDRQLPDKTKKSGLRRKKYYSVKVEKYEENRFGFPESRIRNECPDWT